jgi:hypothetical protein
LVRAIGKSGNRDYHFDFDKLKEFLFLPSFYRKGIILNIRKYETDISAKPQKESKQARL